MYSNPQSRQDPYVQQLRRSGGAWLKARREEVGLSQRDFAVLVGGDYYTFISQIENGRGRIPPERYHDWARALKIEPREFVREVMRYYDPVTYSILFENA